MAWLNPKTHQAEVIRTTEGDEELPSLVYYDDSGKGCAGKDAYQFLLSGHDERVISNIALELNLAGKKTYPGPDKPGVIEIVSVIINKLKKDARHQCFDQPIQSVVISHPVSYGIHERNILAGAVRAAGIVDVSFVETPVAAIRSFVDAGKVNEKRVLVVDIGAKLIDIAFLSRIGDNPFNHDYRLAFPPSTTGLGGDDFDLAFYSICDRLAQEKLGCSLSTDCKINKQALDVCRQAKENLSRDPITDCIFTIPGKDGSSSSFSVSVSRSDFEAEIQGKIQNVVRLTKKVLDEALSRNLAAEAIVLIGGSSRIPVLERALAQEFSVKTISWEKSDTAAVLGALYPEVKQEEDSPPAEDSQETDSSSRISSVDLRNSWADSTPKPFYTIIGHKAAVNSICFSPDSRILASGSNDCSVKLWYTPTGAELGTFKGHKSYVKTVCFSPDGRTVASGGYDNEIKLWDIKNGSLLRTIKGHKGQVNSLCFSEDGHLLASSSDDKSINLWNPQNGDLLHCLRRPGALFGRVINALKIIGSENADCNYPIAVSPDGGRLASVIDSNMQFWDLKSGEIFKKFRIESALTKVLKFSPDGSLIACAGHECVQLWNPDSGTYLRSLGAESAYHALSISFSPDSRILAVGGPWTLSFFDVQEGAHLRSFSVGVDVRAVNFSPDGRFFACGFGDNAIKLWRIKN
jgi:WD40 repeat protein